MINYDDSHEDALTKLAKQLRDIELYTERAKELEVRAKVIVSLVGVMKERHFSSSGFAEAATKHMTILGTVEACARFCAESAKDVEGYIKVYHDSIVEFTIASEVRGGDAVMKKALQGMQEAADAATQRHEEAELCFQMVCGLESRISSLEARYLPTS